VILATDPGCCCFRVVFKVDDNGDKELAAVGLAGPYVDEIVPMPWLIDSGNFRQVSPTGPV